jgi:hypothetical protein
MRERFPHKRRGDPLSHGHVNDLSDVARRVSRPARGSFRTGRHGKTFMSQSALAPWDQQLVVVQSDEGGGLYRVRIRWYNSDTPAWETDTSIEYDLDANDLDLDLRVGDKLVAYWDEQRGMFVPTGGSGGGTLAGVLDTDLAPGGTATMSVWEWNGSNWVDTGDNETVHDWLLVTGQTVAAGRRVVAQRIGSIWVVTAAQCP